VVFLGLQALVIWRFFAWTFCGEMVGQLVGKRMEYFNYTVLLYLLLLAMMLYALSVYFDAVAWMRYSLAYAAYRWAHAEEGETKEPRPPRGSSHASSTLWLTPFCLGSLVSVVATFSSTVYQTWTHLARIRQNRATVEHDRAVQVIALPAVYGVMVLSSMVGMTQLLQSGEASNEKARLLALSKSEACFRVGDLYEAWVLFQFGKLTLELIMSSIKKQECSPEEETRAAAKGLLVAHQAVESLMWLGTWMFVVVCVLQSGWSFYVLNFTEQDPESFESTNSKFTAAGMVASAAAIWNVHTVESTYYSYLEGYSPHIKFISVKILVSFAFFQRGLFYSLDAFHKTLPRLMSNLLVNMPCIGDVLLFSEVEFELFYSSLLLYEILFVAVLHLWAWGADEPWYAEADAQNMLHGGGAEAVCPASEPDPEASTDERQPLLTDYSQRP